MGELAISVENVGKKYVIGHKTDESISERFRNLIGKRAKSQSEEFWALKDVSFEIKYGEAVGIIGKNGAGKSTLLKILSRITHPTTGRFEMNGRVSSLLEVGTGFHPELSGRENIYLNGTILGMTRSEIRSKFDEIVAFSGVEKFLDTPVKHYSSGMYVRLAFSVAAHLEPEILIIDEVLAVGDSEFQKKCLGKMDEVTKQGRTVLFVSHNMDALRMLCPSSILLHYGQSLGLNQTSYIINRYLDTDESELIDLKRWEEGLSYDDNLFLYFVQFQESSKGGHFIIEYELKNDVKSLDFSFHIFNQSQLLVSVISTVFIPSDPPSSAGKHKVKIEVEDFLLVPGVYFITFRAILDKANMALIRLDNLLSFKIENWLIDGVYLKIDGVIQLKYKMRLL